MNGQQGFVTVVLEHSRKAASALRADPWWYLNSVFRWLFKQAEIIGVGTFSSKYITRFRATIGH